MSVTVRRLAIWGVLLALLLSGVVYALRPQPVPMDLASVEVRPLRVSIDDEGEVRVRDVYTLFSPLSGRLFRIQVDPGDPVVANATELAKIEPAPPAFLDIRTEAERRAALEAARSARELAAAELERADANLVFAAGELERMRSLFKQQAVSQRTLDDTERVHRVARAGVETAKAQLKVREHELEQARSRLLSRQELERRNESTCECLPVTAPVTGVVLRVLRRSEGVIEAGTALLEIGNPADIEVVVDLLSEDAVKIAPRQRAVITGWGGPDLEAVVRRIEPFGQTKVSALGIEEQRVDVVLDPQGSPEAWSRLGHGYRVDVRLILFDAEVLTAPIGALFRTGDAWSAFVVEDGRARLHAVQVGQSNGLSAEIRGGLRAGQRVVLYPNDRIKDGVAIEAR